MPRYSIELSGTITRDIIWREVDAIDEIEDLKRMTRENPNFTQTFRNGERAKWWIVQFNPGETVAKSVE